MLPQPRPANPDDQTETECKKIILVEPWGLGKEPRGPRSAPISIPQGLNEPPGPPAVPEVGARDQGVRPVPPELTGGASTRPRSWGVRITGWASDSEL